MLISGVFKYVGENKTDKMQKPAYKSINSIFLRGFLFFMQVSGWYCKTEEIGSGMCIELLKNEDDSAEIYLPSLNFSKIGELRLKLATENIGTVSINGSLIMYGGSYGDIIVKYYKENNIIKVTTDVQDLGMTITIDDPDIITGEAGLMIKINRISDGAKVYVSDLTLNGIKTYPKMRLPA